MQYIGALQKKHSCSSFELLSKTAPIQAASLVVIGPFVDYILTGENVLKYAYTYGAIVSHCQQANTLRLFCLSAKRMIVFVPVDLVLVSPVV